MFKTLVDRANFINPCKQHIHSAVKKSTFQNQRIYLLNFINIFKTIIISLLKYNINIPT